MALKPKKIPQRMCLGCKEMKNKKDLFRIVRTPDGQIILDLTGKKSGRGAYLCRNEECIARARKEKRLEKALECQVPPEIYDEARTRLSNP